MNESQLVRLAKPFPAGLIHQNPSGGGVYVEHGTVTQKLLAVLGPFDFRLVDIIRGDVAGKAPDPNGRSERAKQGVPDLHNVIVGAICQISTVVDGRIVSVDEVGDCEQPHNWTTDGARMKDAMSDALKRCAMRLGVGLHLWGKDDYFLHKQLVAEQQRTPSAVIITDDPMTRPFTDA